MAYTKTTWVNGVTQRNAANFNHMEDGIEANDIAIGKVAVDIADAYSTAKTYAVGDYCINANTLYKCDTDIDVPEAWTASHWTTTTIEAELNAKIATVNDTIGDMKDTTLSGSLANQIDTLNSKLIWKLAGHELGTNAIALPETFNELNIRVAGGTVNYTYHILKEELTGESNGFYNGFSNTLGSSVCQINATISGVRLTINMVNSADYTALTDIFVYYR